MALTWEDVRAWRAQPLIDAEMALGQTKEGLMRLADELATMGAPTNWFGEAAQQAAARLRTLTDGLEGRVMQVSAARRGIFEAAGRVAGVERAVRDLTSFASSHQLSVSHSGTVTDHHVDTVCYANAHAEQLAQEERDSLVSECRAWVKEILRQAEDIDGDLAGVLASLAGTGFDGRSVTSLAEAAAAGDASGGSSYTAPPSGGPADNAAWWGSLSDDERHRILADHPEWLGNRDGIPFAVRDQANRALLPTLRADLLDEKARLEALIDLVRSSASAGSRGGDPAAGLLRELTQVDDKLASLDAVADITSRPDTHLLGLDLSHDRAQAIIANGDVDTADHVAVFTPGLTSTVQGMGGYVRDNALLKAATERLLNSRAATTGETVATVTWLGYQAPQWDTILSTNSVAAPWAAEEGGRSLADFYRGINASRPTDPDLSALGHSYGSTTTAAALKEAGTGVDRSAFFGSPGLLVDSLDDFHTPAGSTSYLEAKWDGVGDLGAFGRDPSALEGMNHLSTSAASTPSGALEESSGHSAYLEQRTTSQFNLSTVVANQPADAIVGRNTGITDDPRAWSWWPKILGGTS